MPFKFDTSLRRWESPWLRNGILQQDRTSPRNKHYLQLTTGGFLFVCLPLIGKDWLFAPKSNRKIPKSKSKIPKIPKSQQKSQTPQKIYLKKKSNGKAQAQLALGSLGLAALGSTFVAPNRGSNRSTTKNLRTAAAPVTAATQEGPFFLVSEKQQKQRHHYHHFTRWFIECYSYRSRCL